MALSGQRIQLHGETPHAHEREAIEFAIGQLPNRDPFHLWGLVDLHDPSTGRLYEIDLLVLGTTALYLVEVKSGPGTYKGDSVDWYRDPPGERPQYLECPYRLANHKAKVLSSLLRPHFQGRAPWIQPLIFLSHPQAKTDLRVDGQTGVVTRAGFVKAIVEHEFPNRDPQWRGREISRADMRTLATALEKIGIRPRKGKLHVGAYELGEVVEDGAGYQDRLAVHRDKPAIRRRARTYLVPQQTSVERRTQLRKAADREADLLYELREHGNILGFSDYQADAPLGPTVLLDAFDGGLRLDAFLRQNAKLPFFDRLQIVTQVGRALAFCHRKDILHGGVSPEAVLVRRRDDGTLETRLFNFQLGSGEKAPGTVHLSALTAQPWLVYQAPEVREDPASRNQESDVFGLGVLAYFVMTGKAPAKDVVELDERLRRQGALDPRAVDDTIPPEVAERICEATQVKRLSRAADVDAWVSSLEKSVTRADPDGGTVNLSPLVAVEGDFLTDNLSVLGVLGQGATSRVLHVWRLREDDELALKASLGPEHDERLAREAQALRRLRHPRIVALHGELSLAGRPCLLLSLAGTSTLQRRLADEGALPLDYAFRWGEDLLSALEYLEGEDVPHRDIKPANLGVGSNKKGKNHLTLFDFSLVHEDPKLLDIGTAAYRDPFLRDRGAWDAAADRWSAALTLHEMLTGVRPSYGGPGGSSVDPDAPLVLATERFEASVRDRLTQFFQQALARRVEDRFESTEAMRRAWTACAVRTGSIAGKDAGAAGSAESEQESRQPVREEELARITPATPLDALPLSPAAKNALDRAGLVRARDLLALRDNRLSALPGVGRNVVQEIFELRDRWASVAALREPPPAAFFPQYRGEDLLLVAVHPDGPLLRALTEAGLRTTSALAAAPEPQVRALAARVDGDVAALHALLDREHRDADKRAHPVTLEGWIDALLPSKAMFRSARVLFGLDAPPAREAAGTASSGASVILGATAPSESALLPLGASVDAAAKALGVPVPDVYVGLGKATAKWQAHPALGELVALARGIVEAAQGALPLEEAAEKLLAVLPHDRGAPEGVAVRGAAALLRLLCELREDDGTNGRGLDGPALVAARLASGALWVCASPTYPAVLEAMARIADAHADRVPLVSPAETRGALEAAVEGTPLAALPTEHLVALAVRASAKAACSARLEVYPRGMPAPRALELTVAVLTGTLTAEEVRRRVADRYPAAEALPERPALDALLEKYGLRFSVVEERYVRPGESPSPSAHTRFHSSVAGRAARGAEAIDVSDAQGFEERLRLAVERRAFRVLPVRADLASRTARALSRALGVPARPLDRLLIAAMERTAAARGVRPDVVHAADREGPTGNAWPKLLRLAELAAKELEQELLPNPEPLLLVQPGLVSRYRLTGLLEALVNAGKRDECAAVLLLLPCHDRGGLPLINGELAIPQLLPSQPLWVSSPWVNLQASA